MAFIRRDLLWAISLWGLSRIVQACGAAIWTIAHGYPLADLPWLATIYAEVHDDSAWYAWIATDGYVAADSVFWPLYPLAVRAVHTLTGMSVVSAGLLLSNVAMVAAIYVLLRLLEPRYGARVARLTTALWALWPTSVYLASAYTESIFVALFWGSALAVERERWWLGGILGALAALTRNTGAVVLVAWLPAAWRAWRATGRLPWRQVASGALVPLAVASYCAYCWWRWGDPLSWSHWEAIWGRVPMAPWLTLWQGLRAAPHLLAQPGWYAHVYFVLEYGSLLLALALLPVVARRCPWHWTLIAIGMLAAPLTAPGLGLSIMTSTPHTLEDYFFSFGRFLLGVVPVYVALALVLSRVRRWWSWVCVASSGAGLVVCSWAVCSRWFLG
ncbi:MAG: hypothetical protein K6T57_15690 [Thermaceae bacterium]|nr:hypothetical protein [Thermaceae bacterium]